MSSNTYRLSDLAKIFDTDYHLKPVFYDSIHDTKITYGEVYHAIYQLAGHIQNICHEPKTSMLIFLENGVTFAISFYAIILSGHQPVLVNSQLKRELASLNSLYNYVITDEKNYQHLSQYTDLSNKKVIKVDANKTEVDNIKFSDVKQSQDTMLYLFTSGSTGEPKFVAKTYANIMIELQYLQQLLNVEFGDIYLPLVPSFHIYGLLLTLLLPLFSGGIIRSDIPFSPKNILADGMNHAHFVIANPTYYSAMKALLDDCKDFDYSQIKCCISSTMPLDSQVVLQLHHDLNIPVMELYGSTETGGIAYREYYLNQNWTFFPHVHWRTDIDHVLEITSPTVSKSEKGNLTDSNEWYSTGDIIEAIGKHSFQLLGRVNQIVKVAGNRVSLIEVETVIKKSGLVDDIVIVGESTQGLEGEILVAYITTQERDAKLLRKQLKQFCRTEIPPFKVPKKFIELDIIPRGVNGKVLFHQLPKIADKG